MTFSFLRDRYVQTQARQADDWVGRPTSKAPSETRSRYEPATPARRPASRSTVWVHCEVSVCGGVAKHRWGAFAGIYRPSPPGTPRRRDYQTREGGGSRAAVTSRQPLRPSLCSIGRMVGSCLGGQEVAQISNSVAPLITAILLPLRRTTLPPPGYIQHSQGYTLTIR